MQVHLVWALVCVAVSCLAWDGWRRHLERKPRPTDPGETVRRDLEDLRRRVAELGVASLARRM